MNTHAQKIEFIENKFNIKLSTDYTDFLLKSNCLSSKYNPCYFEYKVDFLDDPLIVFDEIYGFDKLIEINEEFLNELDIFLKCLIIAEDGGGNFYLVENITGKILYWDRTFLHDVVGECNKVAIPNGLDELMYNKEAIYYLFDSFKDLVCYM